MLFFLIKKKITFLEYVHTVLFPLSQSSKILLIFVSTQLHAPKQTNKNLLKINKQTHNTYIYRNPQKHKWKTKCTSKRPVRQTNRERAREQEQEQERDRARAYKIYKTLLSSFCVGHQFLGMGHSLSVLIYPVRSHWKKLKLPFVSGYQLQTASLLGGKP